MLEAKGIRRQLSADLEASSIVYDSDYLESIKSEDHSDDYESPQPRKLKGNKSAFIWLALAN